MAVTKHGSKRIKQRMGINLKSSEKQSELAIKNGLHPNEVKGRLKKWVEYTVLTYGAKRYIIVYNGMAFIYAKEGMVLITVITLPQHIKRDAINQLKQKKEKVNKNEGR